MTEQMTTPVILNTIRGNALNKGRARVWIEVAESKLAGYGFKRGDRLNIEIMSDGILITAAANGARKMAGRERNGKTICILDICFDAAERDRIFQGSERLTVWIQPGVISGTR